jgi:hypothetical protein
MESAVPPTQQALLFIPDISGFTQFIGDRDFQHRQYIVAELLEVLIEANQLNLKVNEIEGDAIFFYRVGEAPEINDVVVQSEKMYSAFHTHLKKYGISRLCNCATCGSVSKLTLKFIVHYGGVTFHKVKEFEKLFGTDVILAHRLLKNDVPEKEYLLITDKIQPNLLTRAYGNQLSWQPGSSNYDLGEVKYAYSSLASLYDAIPEPEIPEPIIYHSQNPVKLSIEIKAPIDIVHDSLIDLNQRKNYMVGMKGIQVKEQKLNRLNRICTTFNCSMEHDNCTFETSGVDLRENRVTFSETFKEHPMTFEYILERNNGNTIVSVLVHPALKFPKNLVFNLVMKRKIRLELNETLLRLKTYCEGKAHL